MDTSTNICKNAYNRSNINYSINKFEKFVAHAISINIANAALIAMNAAYSANIAYNNAINEIQKQNAIYNANLVIIKASKSSQFALMLANIDILYLQVNNIKSDLNHILNTKKTIYTISDEESSLCNTNNSLQTISPSLTDRSYEEKEVKEVKEVKENKKDKKDKNNNCCKKKQIKKLNTYCKYIIPYCKFFTNNISESESESENSE